jgi:hypothetical protein
VLTSLLAQGSTWLSSLHDALDLLALVVVALTTFIGYKVHSLLFGSKIMERLALLEGSSTDHDRRIGNVEKKVFGL